MKLVSKIVISVAALAITAAPAFAAAPTSSAGKPTTKPTPSGKAYGKYCKDQSKKKIKGQKGTPFSQCVKAMAKLDKGKASSPAKACAGMSKKKISGQKGTPYSKCVSGAAKLQKDKAAESPTTTT